MYANLRVVQLVKIRNHYTNKALRNYGLYFALMLFIAYNANTVPGAANVILIASASIIALYCGERQFFPQIKDSMQNLHFLTIPSQQWEKWLAEFIHTIAIIPIITISPIVAAILLIDFAFPARSAMELSPDALMRAIKIYWLTHPLLFFGAVYFRHSVAVKTFGSIALLFITSAFFVAILTRFFSPLIFENLEHIDIDITLLNLIKNSAFLTLLKWSYFLFFWLMSYLALLELEN